MTERFKITGHQSGSIVVQKCADWKRGEITPVTGSSGLKDYLKNYVHAAFERDATIDRIVLVIGEYKTSHPFCLFERSGNWADCIGERVNIAVEP
jgi:hypothetical protein